MLEEPPADAGDEVGPETVRTKDEILNYLKGSFAHLSQATAVIGQTNVAVKFLADLAAEKGGSDSLGTGGGVIDACS